MGKGMLFCKPLDLAIEELKEVGFKLIEQESYLAKMELGAWKIFIIPEGRRRARYTIWPPSWETSYQLAKKTSHISGADMQGHPTYEWYIWEEAAFQAAIEFILEQSRDP